MSEGLLKGIDEAQTLDAEINLPYTLTTGLAAGSFLAELANHHILGSKCDQCVRVMAPAQDFCSQCGTATEGFLLMPEAGTVTALTRTDKGVLALIKLDGSDTNFLHRLAEDSANAHVGDRVRAVWAETTSQTVLDLDCFRLEMSAITDEAPATISDVDTVAELAYSLNLKYRHAYGPHYGRLFNELASSRRIVGSLCPSCKNVLLPPREFCDLCFVRTSSYVDIADTGILQAFSIIHLEFVGQTRKPPYVYAEIVLDGSATRLIHTVEGIDVDRANAVLHVGMPVRAVWKDPADCVGTLNDIEYFEPVTSPSA